MLPKITLPLLALAGLGFGIYSVVNGNKPVPVAPAVVEPAQAPFKTYIAGAGIIESKNRNVVIGAALPGIVKSLNVKVGDRVNLEVDTMARYVARLREYG